MHLLRLPAKPHRFVFSLALILGGSTCLFAQSVPTRRDPSAGPVASTTASSATLTLEQAFDLALQRSESIDIQEEEIVQAERLMRRTLGTVLPDIRWTLTTTLQDTGGVGSGNDDRGRISTARERTDSRFSATQPIFQGFREFRTLKALRAETRGQKELLRRARALLFQDVALSFYSIVLLEEDRADLVNVADVTRERLGELRERRRLGKSRESEVTTVESQLLVTRADIAEKDAEVAAARALLSFFVGTDASRLTLKDTLAELTLPASERAALEHARNRSDVIARREIVEAQRYALAATRSLRWPGADVTGNYYTKRSGSQSEIDWDVEFNVDVPIYQGGVIKADVAIAKSRLRQAEAELSQAERLIAREIRSGYTALAASLKRTDFLQDAFTKARSSYDSQVREYRLGLVNNLDVLQALRTLEDVKADYNRARIEAKLDWVRLAVSMEQKPDK